MDRKDLYWVDPKPRVAVSMSRFGWRVDVWQFDKLLYSEFWLQKPTRGDREWLARRYGHKEK
jgi:hypothetical protein